MTPALDSCRAFAERLSRLSERITRAGDLLQTQTEMTALPHESYSLVRAKPKKTASKPKAKAKNAIDGGRV